MKHKKNYIIMKKTKLPQLDITQEVLHQVVNNFKKPSINNPKLPLHFGHRLFYDEKEALGYVEDLWQKGDEIHVSINKTPELEIGIREGRFLALSGEWVNHEKTGWELISVAVLGSSKPAIKKAQLSAEQRQEVIDIVYLQDSLLTQEMHNIIISKAEEEEMPEDNQELVNLQEENQRLKTEMLEMKKQSHENNIRMHYTSLVSAGKITPAQAEDHISMEILFTSDEQRKQYRTINQFEKKQVNMNMSGQSIISQGQEPQKPRVMTEEDILKKAKKLMTSVEGAGLTLEQASILIVEQHNIQGE